MGYYACGSPNEQEAPFGQDIRAHILLDIWHFTSKRAPPPPLAWPEPVMCRPNAGRVGQGRVRCGQWQKGAAMDPFDVRRGPVTPVCLAHGSGDSVGLRELLSELASLK
ncbi:hypothetical protein AOLI_G00292780 [Acnodon oligacanthus]